MTDCIGILYSGSEIMDLTGFLILAPPVRPEELYRVSTRFLHDCSGRADPPVVGPGPESYRDRMNFATMAPRGDDRRGETTDDVVVI